MEKKFYTDPISSCSYEHCVQRSVAMDRLDERHARIQSGAVRIPKNARIQLNSLLNSQYFAFPRIFPDN